MRDEKRPGRPIVVRKRVTTWHLRLTAIKSWLRMIFEVAAAISGVMAGARALRVAPLVS